MTRRILSLALVVILACSAVGVGSPPCCAFPPAVRRILTGAWWPK